MKKSKVFYGVVGIFVILLVIGAGFVLWSRWSF